MKAFKEVLIIVIVMLALLFGIIKARADEQYMPNASDGFLTLSDDPCRITAVQQDYPFKALNADDQGNEMEGCWRVTPHLEGTLATAYSVFMYEEGSPNVGTFKFGLFSPEKKRWPEVAKTCDGCGTM